MEMSNAMDYLTSEAVRLEAMGVTKSTVIMSTLTESGNVGRMSITVEIVVIPQAVPEPAKIQPPVPPSQPMNQQQRYSGGIGGGPNPGPMPGTSQMPQGQQNPMMR
jgi:hypothetical protein